MATSVLPIHMIERRMRGGAQSLLVRDGAGNAYVAKCVGNPQGTRTLINEWIVSRLLKYLRVSTPEIRALRIDRGITGDHLLEFDTGNRKIPIAPGVHFGSRCPVDPEQKAIFDFLPRRLLHNVVNLPDLLLAFAFDKWVNQTDSRQAIFIRERSSQTTASFRTYLIDHGQSFGGSRWEFSDGVLNGLYRERAIYNSAEARSECHLAVDRINELPESSILTIEQEIPGEWLEPGGSEELTRLLRLLCGRRTKLHDTIDRALLQVQQSGLEMPKSSHGRRVLGALLLLACAPRSFRPAVRGIEIEAGQREIGRGAQETGAMPAVNDFQLIARSEAGRVIQEYSVRIWRGELFHEKGVASQEHGKLNNGMFFLRVYERERDDNAVFAEYAFWAD